MIIMAENQKEKRVYSVSKPGLTCSAKNCSSGSKDNTEKFFFPFPRCDASKRKQIRRCQLWVKRAGNKDLLSYQSNELADNFYLCCGHFSDWTAVNSTQRYIAANAVPAYFDCRPLREGVMKSFPVKCKTKKTSNLTNLNTSEVLNPPISQENVNEDSTSDHSEILIREGRSVAIETEKQDVAATSDDLSRNLEDEKPAGANPSVERIASPPGTRDNHTSLNESVISDESSSPTNISPVKKVGRPSRKAKQDAVKRMSNRIIPDREVNEPIRKAPRPSLEKNLMHVRQAAKDTDEPRRIEPIAKSSIVSNNVLSKLETVIAVPKEAQTTSINSHLQKSPIPRIPNQPLPNNVQIIRAGPFQSPNKDNCIQDRSSMNDVQSTVFSILGSKSKTSSPENNLIPILKTTASQTGMGGIDGVKMILKILNSDEKLRIFSGIPSYDVLDKLTDATLKMVMNNEAMISDIEPTMREWIIITCTKFMLGISLEALSVMFELPEKECTKIVEKTCLFLRKTLSLQDCQKYMWILPNVLLFGIADFSDNALSVNKM